MRRIIELVFLVAFIGIAGTTTAGFAQDKTRLEIGYMPILPVSQLFVGLEEGWIDAAGIEPDLVNFQNGPAMVQALLAGQLDIAYFGIGPAMVAKARGADIKVVASNIVEQISVIALGPLADAFAEGEANEAFARFEAAEGRKAVIATFPLGSVPETVFSYWLQKRLALDPSAVELVYQGAAQVQQALLTGAVDGAAILEPVVAIVLEKVSDAKVVASGSELFPGQPGAVLAVREGVIADHAEIVQALVAAHDRATQKLKENPSAAAVDAQKYVGGGRLDVAIVEQAVINSAHGWVADPNFIRDGATTMRDFQAETGTLGDAVDLDALFETRFYDAL
ncbi:MAG: ABC transporter substrate-binding protein, partial [Pseudomonadota bacterium]